MAVCCVHCTDNTVFRSLFVPLHAHRASSVVGHMRGLGAHGSRQAKVRELGYHPNGALSIELQQHVVWLEVPVDDRLGVHCAAQAGSGQQVTSGNTRASEAITQRSNGSTSCIWVQACGGAATQRGWEGGGCNRQVHPGCQLLVAGWWVRTEMHIRHATLVWGQASAGIAGIAGIAGWPLWLAHSQYLRP
jgi:hypothetical protein